MLGGSAMSNSLVTPWIIARQAPLSVGFPWQECWSGVPFLLQGIFPPQGSDPSLLCWQVGSLPLRPQGSPREETRIAEVSAEQAALVAIIPALQVCVVQNLVHSSSS